MTSCAQDLILFFPTARRFLPSRDVAMPVENTTFEKHYRVGELARLWGLGRETVRLLVKDDPGVIKIRMGRKKAHTIYSVPESAASRIHTRLLNIA
jgi:hypothetical protein